MKKYLFLVIAALLVANHSSAQYKPKKGSVSTEVQFNPFDQDGEMFKLDGVKVRYFFTENDAFRLKLGFTMKHHYLSVTDDNRDEENPNASYYSFENKYKSTAGSFELNLGYERHFNIAKRLSAYIGASAGFNRQFASTTADLATFFHNQVNGRWQVTNFITSNIEISNGAFETLPDDTGNPLDKVTDRAYWELKAALFAGLDFYVYKGLYVGTEFGLGLNSSENSKMKYKGTVDNEQHVIEFETNDNARNTTLGFYIEPVIRLGWTF